MDFKLIASFPDLLMLLLAMPVLVNLEQVIDWASGRPRSLASWHILVLSFCLLWWREL